MSRTARGTTLRTHRVRLGDREPHRLVIGQVAARPHARDHLEAEVGAKGGLDDLGVAGVGPGRADAGRTQDVLSSRPW